MSQSHAMKTLQVNIQKLLVQRGWSQGDLAVRSGIPRPNINRILRGHETVTVDRAERIAKAFGVSLGILLSDNLEILSVSA